MRERAGSSPVIRTIKELNEPLGVVFLYTAVTDLRQCRLHCRQTLFATCPAMQLTASEDRRKRKAFADIKRSGHSKQIQHAVSVQSTVVRQAQFVLRRRFTVANKFARFAITFALLPTSPVVRTKVKKRDSLFHCETKPLPMRH